MGAESCVDFASPGSVSEVSSSLKKLKKLGATAEDGLVTDMLKGDHSLQALADLFTALLRSEREDAKSWELAKVRCVYRKL